MGRVEWAGLARNKRNQRWGAEAAAGSGGRSGTGVSMGRDPSGFAKGEEEAGLQEGTGSWRECGRRWGFGDTSKHRKQAERRGA